MLTKSTLLSYYKREDIQKEIIENAKGREVATRFNDKFGQRPDVLKYPRDVLELAKQGATSFHASEELWHTPLRLDPRLKKSELEELRTGWDLVLDIDCPIWKLAKITTWLIIKSLKELNLTSVSVKFSGNKGFHIGIPFESFPETINGSKTKKLFPDAPRNIASYLLDYISENHIKIVGNDEIKFGDKFKVTFSKLKELTKKDIEQLTEKHCSKCNKKTTKKIEKEETEFICSKCESSIKANEQFKKCPKCNIFMEKVEHKTTLCKCGSNDYYRKFNALSIIEVDTILISSRHLYRMPYSLHEKSGLSSIVFNPEKILLFEKKYANPTNVKISRFRFLNKESIKEGEGRKLIENAFSFSMKKEQEREETGTKKEFEMPKSALQEIYFPPCIQKALNGLQDGKKRFLFIIVNFLTNLGWDYEKIEKRLKEWNEKNEEPLREVLIVGQLRYHKQQKKRILPPNCMNQMYYKDLQICTPDGLCKKIKNPVNYSLLKVRFKGNEKKTKKENKK